MMQVVVEKTTGRVPRDANRAAKALTGGIKPTTPSETCWCDRKQTEDKRESDGQMDGGMSRDSVPTLERATKFNPMFESDPVTAQYYRRYDDNLPQYSSSVGTDGSKDLSSEEIRHIYQNTTLSKEEIQERLRIIELCARDQHFADFVRQTQVFLERRGSSST